MEIVSLDRLSGADLQLLFEAEGRHWERTLAWDYRPMHRLVHRFVERRILPGMVLFDPARGPAGYSYFVLHRPVAFIGNLFLLDEFANEKNYRALVEGTVDRMKRERSIDRIEAQLFSFNFDLREIFKELGFLTRPRFFLMKRTAAAPSKRISKDPHIRIRSWEDRFLGEAADVVHDSYISSSDGLLCRDYQSRRGCLRFLRNVMQNPACGEFSSHETLVALDRSGHLCGLLFATRIHSHTGMIPQLSIRRSFQGRGIGGLLLQHYLESAALSGIERVALSVSKDNRPARKLYERLGFSVRHSFAAFVWERGLSS